MDTIEDVIRKAEYCLNCKNKPCSKACPVNTDIPRIMECVKKEKLKEAYGILMENNIFSSICGLICPQELQCEGNCIRKIKGNAVDIGQIEVWINEYARENKLEYNIRKKEDNGIKVAVIGSGPASLSCAYELAKEGYRVTIFEKENLLGGILRYGIPNYRLNKLNLDETINRIIAFGIDVKKNCELGKDFSLKNLKEEGFEKIFLGIGAGESLKYKLSEKNLKNIYESQSFLKDFNNNIFNNELGKVVVIGGGDVAIDCARTAIKLGATEVSIAYRRAQKDMPARKADIEMAIKEGIKVIPNTKIIKAIGDSKNKLEKIEGVKTEIIENSVLEIEKSNFYMNVDSVIFAIGSQISSELLDKEGFEINNGIIKVDEYNETNIKGVYAGGDIIDRKSTVCKAIASGKKCAYNIMNKGKV